MAQDANTVVDSSPAAEEVQDSGIDLADLSAEQYDAFMLHGTMPEAKPAETATQPPKTIETPEESGRSKGNQEAGKGKGVEARIEQLDSKIQELQARLARKADLERQLDSDSGAKTAPPPVTETKSAELKAPVKPRVEEFKTWDEYEAAKDKYSEDLTDYRVSKAIQEDRAQRAEEAKKQQQESEGKQAAEKWNKQVESAAKEHSDWNDVIAPVKDLVGKDPRFQAGASFLLESEAGAEILYHLGSNPDEASQIAAMSPIKQIAALARIELSLTKPAQSVKTPPGPKKVTETPPPPSELAGRNQLAPDPLAAAREADDIEEIFRLANAKDIADIAAGKRRR
jgi:hypothetical protein